MQHYFHERGKNYSEIIEKIRLKYGENYQLISRKEVPASGLRGFFGYKLIEYFGRVIVGEAARQAQIERDDNSKTAILTSVGVDAQNVKKNVVGEKNLPGIDTVLQELRDIKGELTIHASTPPPEPFRVLSELTGILKANEFEDVFIKTLLDDIKHRLTALELEDKKKVHETAALIIAQSIDYIRMNQQPLSRIFILVGPTGVGKTTTIAKLAAVHGLSNEPKVVRIITVDSFRIGALAQLEAYGKIMDISVKAVDNFGQLKTQIALNSDADLILVDTIGKSPRDKDRIDEMRTLLSACGSEATVHLAVSATTKTADIKAVLKQFQSFHYTSIVVTKLDETTKVGNLISILSGCDASLSYFTVGQNVPLDIQIASPIDLLMQVEGLELNLEALEKLYPTLNLTATWR